ncbi:hypothetical protein KUV89_14010 [Marinobacter hydrocarbonoclasticus]|nr:hypothetical protein [Marinobacter nauticus]
MVKIFRQTDLGPLGPKWPDFVFDQSRMTLGEIPSFLVAPADARVFYAKLFARSAPIPEPSLFFLHRLPISPFFL